MKNEIIYQDKWCKVISTRTCIILKSKSGKYYFQSIEQCRQKTGLPPLRRFYFGGKEF